MPLKWDSPRSIQHLFLYKDVRMIHTMNLKKPKLTFNMQNMSHTYSFRSIILVMVSVQICTKTTPLHNSCQFDLKPQPELWNGCTASDPLNVSEQINVQRFTSDISYGSEGAVLSIFHILFWCLLYTAKDTSHFQMLTMNLFHIPPETDNIYF